MDKDKSLITRKEHALIKSQHTGGLIDKHLSLLAGNEETHRDDIIFPNYGPPYLYGPAYEGEWSYVGGTKDGVPDGRGVMFLSREHEASEDTFEASIYGEWDRGKLTGLALVDRITDEESETFIGRFNAGQQNDLRLLALRGSYDRCLSFSSYSSDIMVQDSELSLGPVTRDGPRAVYCFDIDEEDEQRLFNPYWGTNRGQDTLVIRDGTVIYDKYGYEVERGEGDEILKEYLDKTGVKKILWPDPSVSDSWIAGDIYGQSIAVLKSKPHGVVEGVRAKIRSDRRIEIRCGEWMTTDEFSGITFYLELSGLGAIGPEVYENGKKIYEFRTTLIF